MRWIPRFHLSTALAMMLAAGIMMGVNLRPSVEQVNGDRDELYHIQGSIWGSYSDDFKRAVETPFMSRPPVESITLESVSWGWPCEFKRGMRWRFEMPNWPSRSGEQCSTHAESVWLNIVAALCLIAIAGILSEEFFTMHVKKRV